SHCARRKDGEVGAALALELELRAFETFADFVVGNLERCLGGLFCRIFHVIYLLLAPSQQVFRLGRVVAVAIDDHGTVAAVRIGAHALKAEPKSRPAMNATNRASLLSNQDWPLLGCAHQPHRRGKAWPIFRA